MFDKTKLDQEKINFLIGVNGCGKTTAIKELYNENCDNAIYFADDFTFSRYTTGLTMDLYEDTKSDFEYIINEHFEPGRGFTNFVYNPLTLEFVQADMNGVTYNIDNMSFGMQKFFRFWNTIVRYINNPNCKYIFVDSPENYGWHIVWQEIFTDILLLIKENYPHITFVVATHSPFITSGGLSQTNMISLSK